MNGNLEDIYTFADRISKSSLVPYVLRGKPSDIAIVLMYGKELGLKPMQSLQSIKVINGMPSIDGKTILSMIYSRIANPVIKIKEVALGHVECEMSRSPESSPYKSVWTKERAQTMGLLSRDNYKKQLNTMLKWRAVTECARVVFADVLQNFYIPDELTENNQEIENNTKKLTLTKKEINEC